MRQRLPWLMAILFLAVTPTASAQQVDDLNLSEQRFAPSPHADDFLTVMGSHVRDTWDWRLGVFFNWSGETLAFRDAAGVEDMLVEGKLTADIVASMSFFRYVSLGIVFPLNLYTMSGDPAATFDGGDPIDRGSIADFTWGDLRLSPKIKILDAKDYGFGLAVAADISVPTGKTGALATDDGVSVMPRLILDMDIEGWRLAINVGYKWREQAFSLRWLDVGQHQFYLGAALAVPLIQDNLDLIAEIETATDAENFFADSHNDYLEGRLALRYQTDFGLGVTVGGGAGFLDAWGSPLYRVFAAIDIAPRDIVRDLDGDGIMDDDDKCPTEAEDADGFEDEDGCPDLDNDKDGIADTADACPTDPEDADGFEDADGCPDLDNDKDGVPDASDKCPLDPEDRDGFEDEDGCPDWDNDGDGVKDVDDKCPLEPEDLDGCVDEDGCPEPGNVCVTETEIKIFQMVYFKTGKATILAESFPLLDEVAQVLSEHPELLVVEVQGHTDDRGSERANLRLSAARAQSVVKYLVKAGVAKKRLTAKGYGEMVPIDTNETDEGRARNRRVEFHIIERSK